MMFPHGAIFQQSFVILQIAFRVIDPYAKPLIRITIDLTTNIDMCPFVSTLFVVKFLL